MYRFLFGHSLYKKGNILMWWFFRVEIFSVSLIKSTAWQLYETMSRADLVIKHTRLRRESYFLYKAFLVILLLFIAMLLLRDLRVLDSFLRVNYNLTTKKSHLPMLSINMIYATFLRSLARFKSDEFFMGGVAITSADAAKTGKLLHIIFIIGNINTIFLKPDNLNTG